MAEKMLNAFMRFSDSKIIYHLSNCCILKLILMLLVPYVCLPRDCAQDFDAVLLSKPPNFKVEMLTMWQDHVGRALLKSGGPSTSDACPDVDEAEDLLSLSLSLSGLALKSGLSRSMCLQESLKQAECNMVVTNLAHDFKEAVAFNLRKGKMESNKRVAQA